MNGGLSVLASSGTGEGQVVPGDELNTETHEQQYKPQRKERTLLQPGGLCKVVSQGGGNR